MLTPLQQFLIDRKLMLLDWEKRANGIAKVGIQAQIQMADVILIFIASQQTEEDMAKLRLTLDKQATPIDDIKPRQENAELTEALIELAQKLDGEFKAQTEKKTIKYPLNNLPDDVKPKSVSSKIYALRKSAKLPLSILPKTRTIKDKDTGETREVIYMVRVTDDVLARFEEKEKALRRK